MQLVEQNSIHVHCLMHRIALCCVAMRSSTYNVNSVLMGLLALLPALN